MGQKVVKRRRKRREEKRIEGIKKREGEAGVVKRALIGQFLCHSDSS